MSANYDYYRVFYRVVECGSMTEAAKELFLAQSTISRTVQNLENDLGSTLFERTAHGVLLTEEGSILHHHLKLAIEHITAAEEKLDSIRRLDHGLLRIGASELTLEHYMLPYLERMKREYPQIVIRLSYSNPSLAVEALNSRLLDLAVLAGPFEESDTIDIMPLDRGDFDYILIAGNGFNELRDKTIKLEELRDYPFICMEKGMGVRTYADRAAQRSSFVLHPECEVGSMPLLVSLVKINLGLAFLPIPHAKKELEAGNVFAVKLSEQLPKESIKMLTNKTPPNNRVFSRFISILTGKI